MVRFSNKNFQSIFQVYSSHQTRTHSPIINNKIIKNTFVCIGIKGDITKITDITKIIDIINILKSMYSKVNAFSIFYTLLIQCSAFRPLVIFNSARKVEDLVL